MLTQTERAASQMQGLSKCQTCKHQSNVTLNGITLCTHGLSPKYCAIYQELPEIALRRAREAFK